MPINGMAKGWNSGSVHFGNSLRSSPTRAQRGARPKTNLELRSDITVPVGGGFLSAIGGFRGG